MLIADEAGRELLAATFAHDELGVSALCDALRCFEVEVVAIERPDGVLVERLLETGVRVLALHPNQVKAARDRFRASGGSLITLTGSCSASWRAPRTVSGCWSPILTRRRRCGR